MVNKKEKIKKETKEGHLPVLNGTGTAIENVAKSKKNKRTK
jgi:hypothetical protein